MVDNEISAEDLAIMAAVKAAVKQGEKVKSQDLLHSWENACQCCYGEGKSQNLTEWDGETYIDEQQDTNSTAADLPITEADKRRRNFGSVAKSLRRLLRRRTNGPSQMGA